MDKPRTAEYATTITEVKRTLKLADKDRIIFLESEKKIIIACELTKK